ncbi:MAG: DUF2397 family protein [Victivallales bacterium]|nr:DUF2397 family protein [Victivallales bacterium]
MAGENKVNLDVDRISAFNRGEGANLVLSRNQNLGIMFASERSIFYVNILLRMLYYRNEHELEPLNEEIYSAVKPAQEVFSGEEYPVEAFNRDIQQLYDWEIVSRRIEKERLRGYKDIRRRKFRFSLTDEAVLFINWLEECYRNDEDSNPIDSRNFLIDFIGRLKEIMRALNRILKDNYSEKDSKMQEAVSVVYGVNLLDDLTLRISNQLGELNARLLGFLLSNYKLEKAKDAVFELEFYTTAYLKQLDKLRREILELLRRIKKDKKIEYALNDCAVLTAEYYTKFPFMSNRKFLKQSPIRIFNALENFYKSSGKLDQLCRRINDTAIKVWGKISAYLRELERKNTRLEDLKARIKEMSESDESQTFDSFFFELLSYTQMSTDSNYWKEGFEKANPPLPRLISDKKIKEPKHFIKIRKKSGSGPVQSLEQYKLEKLNEWIQCKTADNESLGKKVSNWDFDSFEDFEKIVELAEAGILSKGKQLNKLGMELEVIDNLVSIELKRANLKFSEMILKKKHDYE